MVRREEQLRDLSDKFVSVRLVKCNSLDLRLFQIDWDLTFAIVFLNADKTVYARYGSRNSMSGDNDVAIEGLVATMRTVLEIHRQYPDNVASLAAKQPLPVEKTIPEQYPSLDHFKPQLEYSGAVAKSCIHCHQVRDAARLEIRNAGKAMPEKLLYPFPSPRVIGINLDPKTRATVQDIEADSPAGRSSLLARDFIMTVDRHPVASEADFRWLLNQLPGKSHSLNLVVSRDGSDKEIVVDLPANWRTKTDLSWRPTSWDMRRMATGGMTLVPATVDERRRLGLASDQMALRADHVGMYGHHARAKRAGIRNGDYIVSFDRRNDLVSESAVFSHALQHCQPGDTIQIEYVRGGIRKSTSIKLQ